MWIFMARSLNHNLLYANFETLQLRKRESFQVRTQFISAS